MREIEPFIRSRGGGGIWLSVYVWVIGESCGGLNKE